MRTCTWKFTSSPCSEAPLTYMSQNSPCPLNVYVVPSNVEKCGSPKVEATTTVHKQYVRKKSKHLNAFKTVFYMVK